MTTLADVRDDIKSRLTINSTVSDAIIDDCIRQAIRQMRQERYWFLWKIGTVTLSSGTSSVTVPDDFAAIQTSDLLTDTRRYTHKHGFALLNFVRLKSQYYYAVPLPTRRPIANSILDRTLYMSSLADQDYTIELLYTQKDVTLPTMDADTSIWFDEGYDVIRSLAQYIFEGSVRQNPDATQEEFVSMRNRLNKQQEFYDLGLF